MTQQAAAPAGPVTPAPQAPVDNDAAIGNYARGFLQELDGNDNPESLDPNVDAQAPDAEAQPNEQESTDTPEPEAETPAQPEVEMVEAELDDGEKVLVPKKVKDRMMADKDYRHKTMELSAQRKQFETLTATATQLAQQAQQMALPHAQLVSMDNHAQYLQQQLQSGALNDDPVGYNRVQGELAILLHQRGQFASGLQQQFSQWQAQQQELRVQKLALEAPKLYEEFPALKQPENTQKLVNFLQGLDIPPEAMDFISFNPGATKLAWMAHQYTVMVADQAKAQAKLHEKTKTLPAASQSSRAADTGAKDKQLHRDWQKGGGKINDAAFDQLLRSKLGSNRK
jgi:hypothetical protein